MNFNSFTVKGQVDHKKYVSNIKEFSLSKSVLSYINCFFQVNNLMVFRTMAVINKKVCICDVIVEVGGGVRGSVDNRFIII